MAADMSQLVPQLTDVFPKLGTVSITYASCRLSLSYTHSSSGNDPLSYAVKFASKTLHCFLSQRSQYSSRILWRIPCPCILSHYTCVSQCSLLTYCYELNITIGLPEAQSVSFTQSASATAPRALQPALLRAHACAWIACSERYNLKCFSTLQLLLCACCTVQSMRICHCALGSAASNAQSSCLCLLCML